jgi:hypothetical protein
MRQRKLNEPDSESLRWFLGFLEGRTSLRLPRWWTEAILSAQASGHGRLAAVRTSTQAYHKTAIPNVWAVVGTTLLMDGDKAVLQVGNEFSPLPCGLLYDDDDGGVSGRISALITPDRCYVAVHSESSFRYKLYYLVRGAPKIVWEAEVWGTRWGTSSTDHHLRVKVAQQDNRVVVFGAAGDGFHVEAFRADDGSSLFRFASSY